VARSWLKICFQIHSACGFREDGSCTDMIFVVRQQRSHENINIKPFFSFVDLTKAYNSVSGVVLCLA